MTALPLERLPGVRQLPGRLRRRRADVVLFESWRGQYSDNPRGISEALHELRPDLRQVWVVHDAARGALPGWATPVAPGSAAYLAALGEAGHVVASTHLPRYFRPRGAVYVQTWHGTPLKRLGFDIEHAGAEHLRTARVDAAKWDVLLSPNPFSTPIFRRAFRFGGRILETGYPRNDVLRSPEGAEVRRRTRSALGLGDGELAVLYAPTWRDGIPFRLRLDPAIIPGRLLLRLHPVDRESQEEVAGAAGDGVLDVSGHGDIRELYLAADVLVTDYSSSMFDFAVTGKPMVFFTYDLAEYRDVLRGFYFDFEREAPGPLASTTEEVGDALADLDGIAASYADRYAAFAERFCPLDDGRAAERVIDALF